MSLEPGRAAAIPASHREPRGRWRPGPGRPRAIPAVPGGGAIRADQIPGGVTPAGAATTPAREVRAVTDGIRDPLPPGAAAIQDPARRPAGCLPQGGSGGWVPPKGGPGDGSPREKQQGVPGDRPPGSTQPRGLRDGGARGPDVPRDSRGPGNSSGPRRPGGLGWWGALQGGLGVCIIVASAAIGATVTMVARSAPGFLLGLFVVAGTVAAALAVRPRTGWMIFPVPVLSYLVAALTSGVVFDRSVDSSNTALAVAAAQWVADGFFAMALATVLAVVIIAARWFLWRRRRPTPRDPGWPVGPWGPGRAPAGPERSRLGRDAMAYRGRRGQPGRPRRNPDTLRVSRVRVTRGRPADLGVLGTGVIRARAAPALVPDPDPTTSPAGRNGAPGA